MKWLCVLFALFALPAILFSGNLAAWQQQVPAKDQENANRVDDPTQKGDRLRQHGLLFLGSPPSELERLHQPRGASPGLVKTNRG